MEVLKKNKKKKGLVDFNVEPPEFDNVFFYKWRKSKKNWKRKGPLPFSDDSDNCLIVSY